MITSTQNTISHAPITIPAIASPRPLYIPWDLLIWTRPMRLRTNPTIPTRKMEKRLVMKPAIARPFQRG